LEPASEQPVAADTIAARLDTPSEAFDRPKSDEIIEPREIDRRWNVASRR